MGYVPQSALIALDAHFSDLRRVRLWECRRLTARRRHDGVVSEKPDETKWYPESRVRGGLPPCSASNSERANLRRAHQTTSRKSRSVRAAAFRRCSTSANIRDSHRVNLVWRNLF
jgi:hypothetical protein